MRRGALAWGRTALRRDHRGVALVEFALILPVILLLYLGGIQLQDGFACSRKVTIATRAAADLVAQNKSGAITATEVLDSLTAATQVLAPYTADRAALRLSEIATNSDGVTTVQWSKGRRTTGYTPGKVITVPPAMKKPGTYFLLAETTYAYVPPVAFGAIGPLTLGDKLYMVPRNTDKIDCPTC